MAKETDDPGAITPEQPRAAETVHTAVEALPTIPGFRMIAFLGEGGFGRVYLAEQIDLDRRVAIKLLKPERVARPGGVEAFLAEARTLSALDHPRVVQILGSGRLDDGACYLVSKYLAGGSLHDRIKRNPPNVREAAEIVRGVAEGLHFIHKKDVYHRDVKPENILFDADGNPLLADFGLALKDDDYGKGPSVHAGTPLYMSPEQARGESHRVDGRSDIFSLGIIFYEMLTGRRPFRGATAREIMGEIASDAEPRPPRQINDAIPKELERICLKMLAKRITDRYTTAKDLVDDLTAHLEAPIAHVPATNPIIAPTSPAPSPTPFQASTPPTPGTPTPSDEKGPVRIVPKGLRSFDEHDADFFLELLPGARDREGLPDALRFWKTRIEATDPDASFAVGLLYGPSGCGKSSMVKAGLLPRLSKNIVAIHVEATAEETETRLLKALAKRLPAVPTDGGLAEALASLRRGLGAADGVKTLIVIDQFEQWLHAKRAESNTELVRALRHCDGAGLTCLVLVRDDFWMASTRFFDALEIRQEPGRNAAAVDLFGTEHARRVLLAFGRAFERIPAEGALDPEHKAFLDQAVAGLAEDGKIICVRLALFAEMLKGKPWTNESLKRVGGIEGVGVSFLEETFSASTASPEHRLHQKAARAVLKALLPAGGTEIKGEMRSLDDLLDASGYRHKPKDFDRLIRILDAELRLITPTDPEGRDVEDDAPSHDDPTGKYYQLTHDYLVPSLREWLTRKQRETRRGRAELKLAERSALWGARPENRFLPSAWEWLRIRALTRRKDWTPPQRKMMRKAARIHVTRGLAIAALLVAGLWNEAVSRLRAAALVETLKTAPTSDVPTLLKRLAEYRRHVAPLLQQAVRESDPSSREFLNVAIARLPDDPSLADELLARLLTAAPADVPAVRDALLPHRSSLGPELLTILKDAKPGDPRVLPASAALAKFEPESPGWSEVGPKVADALVNVNVVHLGAWLDLLRDVRTRLTPSLVAIFQDTTRSESVHSLTLTILLDYAADQAGLVADVLPDADPKSFRDLFPIVARRPGDAIPRLQAEIAKVPKQKLGLLDRDRKAGDQVAKDRAAMRQARAAVALFRLGRPKEVVPLLRHQPDPRLRFLIFNWLEPLGVEPKAVAEEFAKIDPNAAPKPDGPGQFMDAVLYHPETSERRAFILALGTYRLESFPEAEREPLVSKLAGLYQDDPDAGIHGAAEWTLREWNQGSRLQGIDKTLEALGEKGRGNRRWYVGPNGHTFAIVEGPVEFEMGSPEDEPGHDSGESLRRRRIPRRFVVATKEVTVGQYAAFLEENKNIPPLDIRQYAPTPDHPMIGVAWYEWAAYCNWLSKKSGRPEVYRPGPKGYDVGMSVSPEIDTVAAYRMPTEAEWEYACRAGTAAARYQGDSTLLLERIARYNANSGEKSWRVGSLTANELGLYDMLGNAIEWSHDIYGKQGESPNDNISSHDNINESPRILRGGAFLNQPLVVRSADRSRLAPSYRLISCGFRPAGTYR